MFTGIIREVAEVRQITRSGDTRFRIGCARPAETIEIGASIACNGVCLTVVAAGTDGDGAWFSVDTSAETGDKTTCAGWDVGRRLNLEPAMRLGDEMGGHIVSGHVDGIGTITQIRAEGDSHRITIEAPRALGRFIAPKGSITIDGISLTVNEVEDTGEATRFGINIIPHTWQVTTLGVARAGTQVNLEIDMLARYVARLAEAG